MASDASLWSSLARVGLPLVDSVVAYLPALAGAAATLLLGWVLARLARAAATRVINAVNRLLGRVFRAGALAGARIPLSASAIVGEVIFWVIFLTALTIAAGVAGLHTLSGWLNQTVLLLPDIFLGLATILLGYWISVTVGARVSETGSGKSPVQSRLLAGMTRTAIFAVALIVGLDQIGLNVSFLIAVASAAAGAVFLGFSIAFGFGAQHHVRNLISARTARGALAPGATVRIDGNEGEVLEITQSHIVLDGPEGRVLLPAALLDTTTVVILAADTAAEGIES